MNPPEVYMSTPETEAYTGLKALPKRRVEGTSPPYLKIKNRVVYARSMVDAWMRSHVRDNTSQDSAALAVNATA